MVAIRRQRKCPKLKSEQRLASLAQFNHVNDEHTKQYIRNEVELRNYVRITWRKERTLTELVETIEQRVFDIRSECTVNAKSLMKMNG